MALVRGLRFLIWTGGSAVAGTVWEVNRRVADCESTNKTDYLHA